MIVSIEWRAHGRMIHLRRTAHCICLFLLAGHLAFGQTGKTEYAIIPGGQFEMGDHHNFVDPAHPSDEIPIHMVSLSSFYMGKTTVTVQQYCDYLNGESQSGDRPRRKAERPLGQLQALPPSGTSFVLKSPTVLGDGLLPMEFTADGNSSTLPLEWSGAPAGTKSFALIMHHIDPAGIPKWYWILYNIPADIHSLPKNVREVGTLGTNSINERMEYAPPRSKGPGAKIYIYTIYALSAPLKFSVPAERVNRPALLAAMQVGLLGSAELKVSYTRPGNAGGDREGRDGKAAGDRQSPRNPNREQGPASDRRPQENPGAGRSPMAENRIPASPTPGQTVGLFSTSPQAYFGYTLMAPKHNTVIFLLDHQGRMVHQWKSEYEPGQSVYLKPNGNLIHTCFTHNRGFTGGGEGGRIEELDWEGKLVWEFEYSSDQYLSHQFPGRKGFPTATP